MKTYRLKAQPRELTGRKVKQLRLKGLLPATVYGRNVKSVSVQLGTDEFSTVYQQTGESSLIDLALDKDVRPVLIHNVQKHPVSGAPVHVEFFQVDLKEKVRTNVPLVIVGEPPAVTDKTGVLLSIMDAVEVEALPRELPEKIEVDVTGLGAVGQEITVGDLKAASGVTIMTDGNLTVVKIGALVSKEAEAEAAAEEAAKAAAAAQAPAEGALPEGAEASGEPQAKAEEAKFPSSAGKPQEEKK